MNFNQTFWYGWLKLVDHLQLGVSLINPTVNFPPTRRRRKDQSRLQYAISLPLLIQRFYDLQKLRHILNEHDGLVSFFLPGRSSDVVLFASDLKSIKPLNERKCVELSCAEVRLCLFMNGVYACVLLCVRVFVWVGPFNYTCFSTIVASVLLLTY